MSTRRSTRTATIRARRAQIPARNSTDRPWRVVRASFSGRSEAGSEDTGDGVTGDGVTGPEVTGDGASGPEDSGPGVAGAGSAGAGVPLPGSGPCFVADTTDRQDN